MRVLAQRPQGKWQCPQPSHAVPHFQMAVSDIVSSQIGFVQRRMVSALLDTRWSRLWAFQSRWSDHLSRERNHKTWAAQLGGLRSVEELQDCRLDLRMPLVRLDPGWISARKYEAVQEARYFQVV